MSEYPTAGPLTLEDCKAMIHRHVCQTSGSEPGTDMIVADSIVLAEIIPRIEEEAGIEVPMNDSTARALSSVDGFAALVLGLHEVSKGTRSAE